MAMRDERAGDAAMAEALVINLAQPNWAEGAEGLVGRLLDGPKRIAIEAAAAPAPSLKDAQLLVAIARYAQDAGIHLDVSAPSDPLHDQLARFGLAGFWPAATGDAA